MSRKKKQHLVELKDCIRKIHEMNSAVDLFFVVFAEKIKKMNKIYFSNRLSHFNRFLPLHIQ